MSLRRNIVANYLSQIYVTIIGIALVPLYIKHMGAEAYGLVGFFAMLQAWFALLDLGLTPTISRETARFKGGALSPLLYFQIHRALSSIFAVVAVFGGCALWLMSDTIAVDWLKTDELASAEVVLSLEIMAVSVALRWMGGLYRGVVNGSERLIWMSAFNALIATLRYVGVLVSMWILGFNPTTFFVHQFFVALLEVIGLYLMSSHLLKETSRGNEQIGWSFRSLQPLLKFSLTIAFTSAVWVFVTQIDKLVLSGILPLADYGYFTLAVLVASGIMVVSGPISGAIMPRMARLHAEGKGDELIRVYRNATQLVSVIAGSAAITIAFCAEPLLYAWSGSQQLSFHAAPILTLYAIGNGFLAVSAFPYYLQYSRGDLRYHLMGNLVLVVLLIPAIVYVASRFGGVGAGYVWLCMNAAYLFFWLAYVHEKLVPGLHFSWLGLDVLAICGPAVIVAYGLSSIHIEHSGQLDSFIYTIVFGGGVVAAAASGRKIVQKISLVGA